jgi:hypothetical protein
MIRRVDLYFEQIKFFLLKNQALCVDEFCRLLEWSVVQVRRSGSSDPVWVCKLTMSGCLCVSA